MLIALYGDQFEHEATLEVFEYPGQDKKLQRAFMLRILMKPRARKGDQGPEGGGPDQSQTASEFATCEGKKRTAHPPQLKHQRAYRTSWS